MFAHTQESKEDGGLSKKLIDNCIAVLCCPQRIKADGNKHKATQDGGSVAGRRLSQTAYH